MLQAKQLMIAAVIAMGATVALHTPALAAVTFAGAQPVSDARLSTMRGGFAFNNGDGWLKVSVGIDRLTFINDALAAVTRLSGMGAGTQLIQNGANNTVDSSVLESMANNALGTIIQNSLDNQVIQHFNVYNVSVNSGQIAQAMELGYTVNAALLRNIRY